ncbi:MAG TPA: LytTR family DNA-binding domain-containing protein [Crocinitomicaceae bacterium]|nr:LytTR family DNA-binding domain-containing protein [Crocinitomicaceae bacterium]
MKVVIIDDEKRTREMIAKMIDSFDLGIECFPIGENVQSGIQAIEEVQPDLVLLDIQMPDGTGFDLLNSIDSRNFEVIFVTAFEEYALKAIKFSALDYVLKPIDSEELQRAITKATETIERKVDSKQLETLNYNIHNPNRKKLVLKTHECVHVVDLENVVRCEADRNYTSFFLNDDKKILVSKTLKEYETLLAANQFFRVQQSHLVNLNYVERFDKKNGGSVVMKDGSEVPLSPAKKDLFFKVLESI